MLKSVEVAKKHKTATKYVSILTQRGRWGAEGEGGGPNETKRGLRYSFVRKILRRAVLVVGGLCFVVVICVRVRIARLVCWRWDGCS